MKFLLLFILSFAIATPSSAKAAYIYVDSMPSNTFVGSEFDANIMINTEKVAANAVGGTVEIQNQDFDITQISTANSVINFWTVRPSLSGSSINFEGVALNPGYTGENGHLFSVKLRSKKTGLAELYFSKGIILANDGKGTNISGIHKKGATTISSKLDPLENKVIRTKNSKAVYYVSNNRRYVFLNERIYRTWFNDFLSVEIVDDQTLAHYLIGGIVKPRPNALMFKITTDPKVYVATEKGVLRWIVNESVAKSIFGNGWSQKVVDIADSEIAGFAMGAPVYSDKDLAPFLGDISNNN
jgi:hypothetical protein